MIDESDGQIGAWVLPKHDDRALTLADYVPQETLFWRRRIWNAVGGFVDTEFKFAVDWDLLLRFRHAGAKIVHVPRFLGAFRVHADQKTFVERKVGQAECELLREREFTDDRSRVTRSSMGCTGTSRVTFVSTTGNGSSTGCRSHAFASRRPP